jgi:MFS family permease
MGSTPSSSPSPASIFPLIVCTVLAHTALTGSRITYSLAALHEGASAAFVGLIIGSLGLFALVFAVPVGRWVDRGGAAMPMAMGLASEAVGLAMATASTEPWVLLPAALLTGTGLSMAMMVMQTTIGLTYSGQARIDAFGKAAVGASIASFAGPLVCGLLIDHAGHRAAFASMFTLTLIALVVFWRVWPHLPRPEQRAARNGESVFGLLADQELRIVYACTIGLAVAWDAFQFVMPIHGRSIGLSASVIGALMSTFAVAIFCVRISMKWLTARFTGWSIIRGVFLVAMLVYASLPLVHSVWLLFAMAFILGLALGCPQPSMLSLLHQAAPQQRAAEAVGLRQSLGSASSFALPTFFGAVSGLLGFAGVFVAVAVMLSAGGWLSHRRVRLEHV